MPIVPGVHRADHADVVDDARRRRKQFRDLGAALSVLRELPRAAEELLVRPLDEAVNDVATVLGPMMFGQLGLGVEQVDVRRPAVHEHRDHRRRLRSEVRRLRLEIKRQVLAGLLGRLGQQPLLTEQVRQGKRPDAEAECMLARELHDGSSQDGGLQPATYRNSLDVSSC